jgi:hypothetical protein
MGRTASMVSSVPGLKPALFCNPPQPVRCLNGKRQQKELQVIGFVSLTTYVTHMSDAILCPVGFAIMDDWFENILGDERPGLYVEIGLGGDAVQYTQVDKELRPYWNEYLPLYASSVISDSLLI